MAAFDSLRWTFQAVRFTRLVLMKAYLITTGTVFGLITLAHIWKAFAEGPHLARDPFFIGLTLLAAGLCVWAFRLLGRQGRA